MSNLVYKILGALSGLVLYWSVSPPQTSRSTPVSLLFGSIIATAASPATLKVLIKFGVSEDLPDGLFIAAAINGLFILPVAKFVSVKASSRRKRSGILERSL